MGVGGDGRGLWALCKALGKPRPSSNVEIGPLQTTISPSSPTIFTLRFSTRVSDTRQGSHERLRVKIAIAPPHSYRKPIPDGEATIVDPQANVLSGRGRTIRIYEKQLTANTPQERPASGRPRGARAAAPVRPTSVMLQRALSLPNVSSQRLSIALQSAPPFPASRAAECRSPDHRGRKYPHTARAPPRPSP